MKCLLASTHLLSPYNASSLHFPFSYIYHLFPSLYFPPLLIYLLLPAPFLSPVPIYLLLPSPSFQLCQLCHFWLFPLFNPNSSCCVFPLFLTCQTDLSTGIHCVVEPVCSSALHGATKARRTTVEVGIRVALTLTLPRSHTVHLLAHCSKALLNTNWLSCIESER